MSDLKEYAKMRAQHDPEFAEGFESGYEDFKGRVLATHRATLPQEV